MRNNDFSNAVTGVPSGLIACRLNGEQKHICAIAKNALWLRFEPNHEARGSLEVCFCHADGKWKTLQIHHYNAEPARCDAYSVLVRLSFFQPDFETELNSAMSRWAEYIHAFSEGDVQSLVNYPVEQDEIFSDQLPGFPWLRLPENREICLSLQDPGMYALYLNHPLQDFLSFYAKQGNLPRIPGIRRLYIGNGFCRQLFPDPETLNRLLAKAKSDGLAVTLATAPDPRLSEEILCSYCGEILVNDWGLLHRLQAFPKIEPVLGPLLNKRRKDPRMACKPDLNPQLLRKTNVNSPRYRQFLQSYGVNRLEFERCGYDFDVPEGKCSLHLPFYQTNTSVYCPTRALCIHGDRAAQSDDEGCPRYCMHNKLHYPSHLKLFARWNSLFAIDDRPPADFSGFDRIVLNL